MPGIARRASDARGWSAKRRSSGWPRRRRRYCEFSSSHGQNWTYPLSRTFPQLLQDEQAKQQRIEQLREKRRTERLQREQREQDRLRHLDNVHRADAFNRQRLLRRYGLDAFAALVRLKRRNLLKADAFRVFVRLRRCFGGWLAVVEAARAERERRAERCARRQRMRNAFATWMQVCSLGSAVPCVRPR